MDSWKRERWRSEIEKQVDGDKIEQSREEQKQLMEGAGEEGWSKDDATMIKEED